ncbi:MAG: sigma-70 family RNA polymerase sigma factor [Proteobacteria bacterium]|nr:sigma-70 family RNA polymerase sigma factor [Pseudomonadota bacterium]
MHSIANQKEAVRTSPRNPSRPRPDACEAPTLPRIPNKDKLGPRVRSAADIKDTGTPEMESQGRTFNFCRWLKDYQGLVTTIVRHQIYNTHDAEEIVQEIWSKLSQVGHRYDSSIAPVETFIGTIARRTIIDSLRRRGCRPTLRQMPASEDGDDTTALEEFCSSGGKSVSDTAIDSELCSLALQRIRKVGGTKQLLLEGHFLRGLPHQKIAELYGIPLGTVKSTIFRAKEELREYLQRHR